MSWGIDRFGRPISSRFKIDKNGYAIPFNEKLEHDIQEQLNKELSNSEKLIAFWDGKTGMKYKRDQVKDQLRELIFGRSPISSNNRVARNRERLVARISDRIEEKVVEDGRWILE